MPITIRLPDAIEQQLRASLGNLDAALKEAALVELYRQGQLSHGRLAECLELSRPEVDEVLARHHVSEDLLTFEEFEQQARELRGLGGQ